MIDFLKHLDRKLLYLANDQMSNPFFDRIMPWWRDKNNWTILYILLCIWMLYLYKQEAWKVFIAVIGLIIATDKLSSSVIKPLVHRLRPCQNPEVAQHIHRLINCGAGYSFVSAHATNHFGLAVFFSLTIGKQYKWTIPIFILWASVICVAQVYVGVHYPFDVIGGAILGAVLGYLAGLLVDKWIVKNVWNEEEKY